MGSGSDLDQIQGEEDWNHGREEHGEEDDVAELVDLVPVKVDRWRRIKPLKLLFLRREVNLDSSSRLHGSGGIEIVKELVDHWEDVQDDKLVQHVDRASWVAIKRMYAHWSGSSSRQDSRLASVTVHGHESLHRICPKRTQKSVKDAKNCEGRKRV